MPRVAAIDIGTNSVKLSVLDIGRGRPKSVLEEVAVTRLGEGVRGNGLLRPAAVKRTLSVIRRFDRKARSLGAAPTLIATEALRKAKNKNLLVSRLRTPLRILSRRQEAQMSFLGAMTFLRSDKAVMVDIGGGTIEILVVRGAKLIRSATLPLGCVYLTEHFLKHDPPRTEELAKLEAHVQQRLSRVPLKKSRTLVGIGGSVATVAFTLSRRKKFDTEVFNGFRIPVAVARRLYSIWSGVSARVRIRKHRVDPKRADVIVAAMAVLLELASRVSAREIVVCTYGVRHGVLLSRSVY